jgi:hypothetical protein
MRVTVQLIRGHTNSLFERAPGVPSDEASWDPDESDEHASHAALNPSCARCVIATGDWKLVEPETRSELPEPAEE